MTAPEDVWRRESPHVLAALLRRYGGFGDCEDALQEALLAAYEQWPSSGTPDHPRGWLLRVASRRLIDARRSAATRAAREERDAAAVMEPSGIEPSGDETRHADDTVHLLLLCCHPSLSAPAQIALALRAVAGLTTRQIAAAFCVPEATMAQRISRAKRQVRDGFTPPNTDDLPRRLSAVLHMLHLLVTEAHTTSVGTSLMDRSLADESLTLIRRVHTVVADHNEATGLLALALILRARAASRLDAAGDLIPLERQDRDLWDADLIAEGVSLLEQVLPRGPVGPFQLQAAIAAVHAESPTWEATDWPQIVELYAMLDRVSPGPAITLGYAVALARRDGPEAGLRFLDGRMDASLRATHRTDAVRGQLLAELGRDSEARAALESAARATRNISEQRFLNGVLIRLDSGSDT